MLQDIRFAFRTFAKNPGFTAVVVMTLALGIGANTAIFSFLDQVLLRYLPVAEPDRLVVFHAEGPTQGWNTSDSGQTVFSYPMYQQLRDQNTTLAGVIARAGAAVSLQYQGASSLLSNPAGNQAGGQTERASAEIVSGNFFEVLGMQPVAGRFFTQAEDAAPGANPVVVLDYGFWKKRFAEDRGIVNQTVTLNGHPMTIVGVLPPGFKGLVAGQTPDLYVPISSTHEILPRLSARGTDGLKEPRISWLSIFGRLKAGLSREQAESGMQPVFRQVLQADLATMKTPGERFQKKYLAKHLDFWPASRGTNDLSGNWRTPLIALMAMVGLVLMIACANVAGLLVARSVARRKEIAIRLSLGATRWTIVRLLVLESILMSLAGGVVGMLVASWIASGLIHVLPADATGGWLISPMDNRVLLFNFVVALVTGVVFGLVPALQATRPDVAATLKEQSAGSRGSAGQAALRRGIVIAQVALSLLLLVGAGLFSRSLRNLIEQNLGFRPDNMTIFSVDPELNGYDVTRRTVLMNNMQARLSQLPGVRSVGVAAITPMTGNDIGSNITLQGYHATEDENMVVGRNFVSPRFFATMAVPLRAGREFSEQDGAGAPKVAIVNEAFAKRFLKGGNPVGSKFGFGGGPEVKLDYEIVGLVGDLKYSLRAVPTPFIYTSYAQEKGGERMTFFVRTIPDGGDAGAGTAAVGPAVRQLMRQIDASLPVFDMRTMKAQTEESAYREQLVSILSIAFGVLAALLAATGLYGVIAYSVTRRTSEIGVRMALGAQRADVVWLVLREIAWMVAAGVALGVPLALALALKVQSVLFGIRANDPLVYLAAAVAMILVALAAGSLPSFRAANIDPTNALRYE